MKFTSYLLALLLVGCVTFAHAAPERGGEDRAMTEEQSDPISRFASGEDAVGDLLMQAMSLIGVAYRFGGSNPETGLDCSGFIQYAFKKSLHVTLPRTAAGMAQVGREVERDELKPGDLVFFNTRGFRYSHAGIYIGNNKFIHSPRTGKSVEVANMTQSYWVGRYNGARRVARGAQYVAEAPAREVEAPRKAADAPRAAKGKSGKAAAEQASCSKSQRKKGSCASAGKSRQDRREAASGKKSRSGKSASGKSKSAAKAKPASKKKAATSKKKRD